MSHTLLKKVPRPLSFSNFLFPVLVLKLGKQQITLGIIIDILVVPTVKRLNSIIPLSRRQNDHALASSSSPQTIFSFFFSTTAMDSKESYEEKGVVDQEGTVAEVSPELAFTQGKGGNCKSLIHSTDRNRKK